MICMNCSRFVSTDLIALFNYCPGCNASPARVRSIDDPQEVI